MVIPVKTYLHHKRIRYSCKPQTIQNNVNLLQPSRTVAGLLHSEFVYLRASLKLLPVRLGRGNEIGRDGQQPSVDDGGGVLRIHQSIYAAEVDPQNPCHVLRSLVGGNQSGKVSHKRHRHNAGADVAEEREDDEDEEAEDDAEPDDEPYAAVERKDIEQTHACRYPYAHRPNDRLRLDHVPEDREHESAKCVEGVEEKVHIRRLFLRQLADFTELAAHRRLHAQDCHRPRLQTSGFSSCVIYVFFVRYSQTDVINQYKYIHISACHAPMRSFL